MRLAIGSEAARARVRGFTLIEILVAVAIIGILAAIAIPQYQQYILKSRRADAKTALLDLASREERFYTLNNTYTNVAGSLGYAVFPAPLGTAATPDYLLSVVNPNPTGNAYKLQAVPQGNQVNDACGTYTIDNFGNQSNVVGGVAAAVAGCW